MPVSNNGSSTSAGANVSTAINPDKAIARLLFAMLKQKSLKDIDWNLVACDPVLLEEISNGHAARMRYSRFRSAVENSTRAGHTRSGQGQKPKAKLAKSRRDPKNTGKRLRDQEFEDDFAEDDVKTAIETDEDLVKTEIADNYAYGLSLDLDLNLDVIQPDTPREPSNAATDKALEDLTADSLTSSLPSPPTESNATMQDALTLLERKKKMRKLYTFSPTIRPQTLHQIPLPRSSISQTAMGASRMHSLPALSATTAASASPASATAHINLSGPLMMRQRSASSLAAELNPHNQQQQQILRQTRMMTPSSDVDRHSQYSHHPHHRTQLSLPVDGPASGLDTSFDFVFTGNGNGNGNGNDACSIHNSRTAAFPSPWIATPYASPSMAAFDMSPYTTTLDTIGGGVGGLDNDLPLPSLFQTQFDNQQQQEDALQSNFMARAFTKHGSWDAMLGQGIANPNLTEI
ncbi:hypothetical protein SEPCBS57363_002626 [Sporothrix epigloea]|uniref:Myb-like DNA-binding domain-containing protein n=1 Tax=Sporothrix epigloea TaxID=1892477 RepID=A0ABP0DGY9_9PEZI